MKWKEYLQQTAEAMTEFTKIQGQPMLVEYKSLLGAGADADNGVAAAVKVIVSVDGRPIWVKDIRKNVTGMSKEQIDFVTDGLEENLCLQIVSEMTMFAIDGMAAFYKKQDEANGIKVINRPKIITDLSQA